MSGILKDLHFLFSFLCNFLLYCYLSFRHLEFCLVLTVFFNIMMPLICFFFLFLPFVNRMLEMIKAAVPAYGVPTAKRLNFDIAENTS